MVYQPQDTQLSADADRDLSANRTFYLYCCSHNEAAIHVSDIEEAQAKREYSAGCYETRVFQPLRVVVGQYKHPGFSATAEFSLDDA